MTWFDRLVRPELSQLKAYRPAEIPDGSIRLDANESPVPLSLDARRRVADEIARVELHRYPDVRATRLRELVAERSGAHPDQVVLGVGSDEVIAMLLTALAATRPGRAQPSIAFPEPTFVMFRITALAMGMQPVGVPLGPDWQLDAGAMIEAIRAHAPNVVFLPSPNNPTGNLFDRSGIESIVEAARGEALVVLDEAYGAFSGVTYRDLRERESHVAQLQTLSKVGFAAIRTGWAIVPKELAAELDKVRQPYNLNVLSQRVATLALTELRGEVEQAVAQVCAERERLAERLAAIDGLDVTPSAANFVWVRTPRDAADVYAALVARGIFVRSFHAAGGRLTRQLRISVGLAHENDALIEAIRAAV